MGELTLRSNTARSVILYLKMNMTLKEACYEALNDLRVKRLSVEQYANSEESGADLIKLIREERERELCLEGHRWFDLRRYMVWKIGRKGGLL